MIWKGDGLVASREKKGDGELQIMAGPRRSLSVVTLVRTPTYLIYVDAKKQ